MNTQLYRYLRTGAVFHWPDTQKYIICDVLYDFHCFILLDKTLSEFALNLKCILVIHNHSQNKFLFLSF